MCETFVVLGDPMSRMEANMSRGGVRIRVRFPPFGLNVRAVGSMS
jgi:hypothetical protein